MGALTALLARLIGRARPVPQPAPLPVVAVGSLSHGGTGKTPTVIALAQHLAAQGRVVHVVTSGTGAPRRVDERRHRPDDVGDEALLIAAFAPTWVADDPMAALAAAKDEGAEVVVLEGGLPVPQVVPDVAVLVEDAVRGLGNRRARPFGPLKIPLKVGVAEADVMITVGTDAAQDRFAEAYDVEVPTVPARLVPLQTGMDWGGMRVYAFAGIGVPERFFASLQDVGAKVVAKHALTDHQELTPALMTRMEREAWALGAQMVTTEKDAIRLPSQLRPKVLVLPVRLDLHDWSLVDELLLKITAKSSGPNVNR